MSKKTLIIDCQIFQTPAWHRGMGKYSWELLKAILESKSIESSDVFIVLNTNLELADDVKQAIDKLVKPKNIISLDLAPSAKGTLQKKAMLSNEVSLSAGIAEHNLTDYSFLILSPLSDELAPAFPRQAKTKLSIVYDLIPYIFHERYRHRIDYENYLSRFKLFFEADTLFSISETVKNDLISNIGIAEGAITNIDGSFIGHFSGKSKKPKGIKQNQQFVLMPTGEELRKNNHMAVRAFELFRTSGNEDVKLIATSFFSEPTKAELSLVSEGLIFSGNIPGDELKWLFENAECLLFPSEYEGLGMPVLEGVRANLPVACSDISVFNEMSHTAFHYFDPHDAKQMSTAIHDAFDQNKVLTPDQKSEYSGLMNKYTWGRSAELVIKQLDKAPATSAKRPKLAVLTPHIEGYSAIGKVVAESHYALAKIFDVTYYYDSGPNHRFMRPDFVRHVAKTQSVESFDHEVASSYDMVLYHIGNSEYHMRTIVRALQIPGITVLHDTHLYGLYENLLQFGAINKSRIAAEEMLSSKFGVEKSTDLVSIVNSQKGFITHSEYAKSAVEEALDSENEVKVTQANLPSINYDIQLANSAKKRLRVGVAGILADVKGLDILQEAASSPRFENCEFHLFGLATGELKKRLHNLSNVFLAEDPTDYEFQRRMSQLDVLINYREKYNGETSLTTIEAMKYGVVVLVRNVGWYGELPDNVVVKLESKDEVYDAIIDLETNRTKLKEVSLSAKKHIHDNFTHAQYAKKIHDLYETISSAELLGN